MVFCSMISHWKGLIDTKKQRERPNEMRSIMRFFVIGLFIFMTLFGCSKLNRENYDKIKVGMDYQEVVSIIGEPDK